MSLIHFFQQYFIHVFNQWISSADVLGVGDTAELSESSLL